MARADYARALESTAGLVRTIIQSLLDVRAFVFIMLAIFVGFASSFHFLFMDPRYLPAMDEEDMSYMFGTPLATAATTYSMLVGAFDVAALRYSSAPTLALLFFIMFSFVITIVLLNLLISILGDSFDRTQERLDVNMRRERALLLVEIERQMPSNPSIRRLYAAVIGARYPKYLKIVTAAESNLLAAPFLLMDDGSGTGNNGQWQGRVRALKTRMEKMEANIQREIRELHRSLEQLKRGRKKS